MGGKSRRNAVTDDQIVASYRETNSVYKTAEVLGIGATTVLRVLIKRHVPRKGLVVYRRNATKFRGQEKQIRKAYEAGATYAQLHQRFDPDSSSDYALKQALKRAGAELRENPAPLEQKGEIDRIKKMLAKGMSQQKIAITIGRSQPFISRVMRKHGIPVLRSAVRKGPDHIFWKGGRYKDSSGYIRAWVAPDDPMVSMALNTGHVMEHRLVMARKLGRPLTRRETIHHKDGNRTNNDPANLQLRNGKHGKGVRMCCLNCGSYNISVSELD